MFTISQLRFNFLFFPQKKKTGKPIEVWQKNKLYPVIFVKASLISFKLANILIVLQQPLQKMP